MFECEILAVRDRVALVDGWRGGMVVVIVVVVLLTTSCSGGEEVFGREARNSVTRAD